MKRLYKSFIISLIAALGLVGFTGCGDEITEQYYSGVEAQTYNFEVFNTNDIKIPNRWVWNGDLGRYECSFNFRELTPQMYEQGIVHASVFINEIGENSVPYETLKSLPFIRTYWDNIEDEFYSEFINYDITKDPATICFYIETTNGYGYDDLLIDYQFKVTLLSDPNKR